jgi:hypothetical protein
MAVRLCMISTFLPGLFQRVTQVVVYGTAADLELIPDLVDLIEKYGNWAITWSSSATEMGIETHARKSAALFDVGIMCKYLGYYAMCNRLLVVVSPPHREKAESTAIKAARDLISLAPHFQSPTVAGLGIVLGEKVARSILDTSRNWRAPEAELSVAVRAHLFKEWCNLLDRNI